MLTQLKCIFGLHQYEVLKEEELRNPYGAIIGLIIVSRCKHCGKIKEKPVYTDNNYRFK